MPLSDKQRETYRFICCYIKQYGYSPKLSEIAKALGIQSRGVVHRYVQALVKAKLITLEAYRHRGISLVTDAAYFSGSKAHALPLLGYIAAGEPIEAINTPQEINLTTLFTGDQVYVLQVRGDSMIEEGIFDGDFVVCESKNRACSGEIVVALIDQQEATLKRIKYLQDGMLMLIPANQTMQAMMYQAQRVTIQGIVIGVLRVA